MWNHDYKKRKDTINARFWYVGHDPIYKGQQFKISFQKTDGATARVALDNFIRDFADEDFRNEFLKSKGKPVERAWEAKQEARQEAKLKAGRPMKDLWAFWLTTKSHTWSANYIDVLNAFWKTLAPKIAEKLSSEITPSFMLLLDAELSKTNSRNTVNRKLAAIVACINHAFDADLLSTNPLAKYTLPADPKPKSVFWSDEEVLRFLKVTNERYKPSSPRRWIFVAYLTALSTGLRANELWALRPNCLDRENNCIHIREQWQPKLKKFVKLKSKDEGEGRSVPMTDELYVELMELVKQRDLKDDELFFGLSRDDHWFRAWSSDYKTTPVDHRNFSKRAFVTDLRLSGNKKIVFHELRHSAATLMRRNGVTKQELQSILGHTNLKTTARYDHALDRSASIAAKKMPKLSLFLNEKTLSENDGVFSKKGGGRGS